MLARVAVLLALAVFAASACSGDGADSTPDDSATSSSSSATVGASEDSTTLSPAAREEIAASSILPEAVLPGEWKRRPGAEPAEMDGICRDHATDLDRVDSGADPAEASMTAGSATDALPLMRQHLLVYPDVDQADDAYELRASLDHAFCTILAGALSLEGDGGSVSADDLREVDPGALGDESAAWLVTLGVAEADVAIEARVELVTFRVGPTVGTVVLASSPVFSLSSDERAGLLEAAARGAQVALAG